MKAVVERVKSAALKANGSPFSEIKSGLLVFVGIGKEDTIKEAELLAKKILQLRIFCDENDKMNLSAIDLNKQIMAVSNFTLFADTKKGNRPSFINAKEPDLAKKLYEHFCIELSKEVKVETGVFGADMEISNVCDGPVTIILDTDVWLKR